MCAGQDVGLTCFASRGSPVQVRSSPQTVTVGRDFAIPPSAVPWRLLSFAVYRVVRGDHGDSYPDRQEGGAVEGSAEGGQGEEGPPQSERVDGWCRADPQL